MPKITRTIRRLEGDPIFHPPKLLYCVILSGVPIGLHTTLVKAEMQVKEVK